MRVTDTSTSSVSLNKPVFGISAAIVVAIALWALIAPTNAESVIGSISGWTVENFGWWYVALATAIVVFVLVVAFSRLGDIRLGPEDSRPEYNLFTWTSMLFAAGIGLDLMYFAVAEPVMQYLEPPVGEPETVEAAREAISWTLFHYGVTGWGMYALMGLAMAYFAFRRNLPLAIRSALYPILGKRAQGAIGDGVNIAAVLGTIFGIATSLGIGIVFLNVGLNLMFGIEEGRAAQVGLVVLSVLIATISAVSGVDRGIRILSELNVALAGILVAYILIAGKSGFLLNGLVLNVGDYVSSFAGRTLDTMAWDDASEWMASWTLFFWAWWVAWACFVGMFLARISRGRTVRQFVLGVLTIPFGFIVLWISIYGNAALDLVRGGNAEFGAFTAENNASGFYLLLQEYPGETFLIGLATLTGLLFYVTSADSGSLVLGNFTSNIEDPLKDCHNGVRIFWSLAIGLLTIAMLFAGEDGSIGTLQAATIIMGLPFSFVLVLVAIGLYKALSEENLKRDSGRQSAHRISATHRGERRDWRTRVLRTVAFPTRRETESFIEQRCVPAFEEAAAELRSQGFDAEFVDRTPEGRSMPHPTLTVELGDEPDFVYGIAPTAYRIPTYATLTSREKDVYYRCEVQLEEGGQGYDVNDYSQEQLLGDLLDQFDQHLAYLHLKRTQVVDDTLEE